MYEGFFSFHIKKLFKIECYSIVQNICKFKATKFKICCYLTIRAHSFQGICNVTTWIIWISTQNKFLCLYNFSHCSTFCYNIRVQYLLGRWLLSRCFLGRGWRLIETCCWLHCFSLEYFSLCLVKSLKKLSLYVTFFTCLFPSARFVETHLLQVDKMERIIKINNSNKI